MKILVADDSIITRHLLNSTLKRWGYEVVLACDGNEAWEILTQDGDPPRLAVLDWMMPEMTGLEICRRLREAAREPYIYVVLLTSKSLKEDLIQGMESGADDYLVKPFDQHELNVRLRAATRVVELQAELVATREALREQATKDSLTSVWNRPTILELLNRELARSGRENRPVGIILVDLDNFKSINDTHGHFAGDLALREAVNRMKQTIRTYDSIGRYGGEEFLILLPGCDEHTTYVQAERLRTQLASAPVPLPGKQLKMTASFGCTSIAPGHPLSGDDLIKRADEALYLAKKNGRNRSEFLTSLMLV